MAWSTVGKTGTASSIAGFGDGTSMTTELSQHEVSCFRTVIWVARSSLLSSVGLLLFLLTCSAVSYLSLDRSGLLPQRRAAVWVS